MSSDLEIWLAMAVALLIPLGAAGYGLWSIRQVRKRIREISMQAWGSAD